MTLIAAEQTKVVVFLRERKQGRLMEGADIFSVAEIILSCAETGVQLRL
jgi:hypothetical protein